MDAATSPKRNQYDPNYAWQDVGTSELSPFSSANLNLEVLPDNDIMGIVMKRKLRGSRNELIVEISPPEKRLKQERHSSSTDISSVKEWSESLSVKNKHQHDVCSNSTKNKVGDEWNVTDKLHEDQEKGFHCVMEVDNLKPVESTNLVGIMDNYSNDLNDTDITPPNNKFNKFNNILPTCESESEKSATLISESQTNTLSVRNVCTFDMPMVSHRSEQNESEIECLNNGASLKDVSFDENRSAEEKSHESGQMNGTSTVKKDRIENKDKLFNDPSSDNCEENVTTAGMGNVDNCSSKKSTVNAPELPEEILKEVKDICTSVDEVDSFSTVIPDTFRSKGDGKKSRKQHKPQRVPKVDPNSALETPNKINILRNVVKTLKPEKSRKQDIPKRVVKESDTNGSDLECYFDDENEDSFERIDDEGEDYSTFEQPANSNQDYPFNERVGERFFEDKGRNSDNDNKDSFSKNTFDQNILGGLNFNTSNSLPLHFQTALLAYNSNKLIQSPLSSDLAVEKLMEHNQEDLTENLEVVKKLREIRYNRYRKISVTEKKEIAEFAKVNGVSTAASHFGVSKSAVSMWTRIDFDEIDDDKESKKKNCMVGNEAFMELLVRVRNEKSNKFKGLSREDKFEVSRYAKLIGVREMARRLDIALGTVSGWMRQFPYMIKSANQEEVIGQYANEEHETNKEDCAKVSQLEDVTTKEILMSGKDENYKNETPNNPSISAEKYNPSKKIKTEIPDSTEKGKQVQNQYIEKSEMKETENTDSKHGLVLDDKKETRNKSKDESKTGLAVNQINSKDVIIKDDIEAKKEPGKNADELDTMIAETYETPDINQCFDDAKQYLQGTFLENDKFFEILFKRVVECRADKYKGLKASEKLEVVRYAKRIGVRRVAKILGLATGTLSGWTTKYQGHLGLTSDGIIDMNTASASSMSDLDSSLDTSQNASYFSKASDSETINESLNLQSNVSTYISPASSILDEKAEVTAVKLILKDRFVPLRDKIEIARTIKFRNITREEKIEVVKCTKLAGIRPTARVLNMPIGTLSGWITKYTSNLHPVYQEECDRLGGPSVHRPSQSVNTAMSGNQSYVYNIMNSQWPGIHHLSSLYKEPAMDFASEIGKQETNLASLCGKPAADFMLENVKQGNNMSLQNGNQTEHNMSDKEEQRTNPKTEPTNNPLKESKNSKTDLLSVLTESMQGSMLQRRNAESYLTVKTEPVDVNSVETKSKDYSDSHNTPSNVAGVNDNASDGFEEEAKSIAADYLQSVYKKFGFA